MTGVKDGRKGLRFPTRKYTLRGDRFPEPRKGNPTQGQVHRTAIGNSGETTQTGLHLDPFLQCYLITLLHLFASKNHGSTGTLYLSL